MALGNIGREPRREITESLLGILAVVPFFYLDYRLSVAWDAARGPNDPVFPAMLFIMAIGLVIGAFILFVGLLIFLAVTHSIGEWICDRLDDMGIDPRPRNRY